MSESVGVGVYGGLLGSFVVCQGLSGFARVRRGTSESVTTVITVSCYLLSLRLSRIKGGESGLLHRHNDTGYHRCTEILPDPIVFDNIVYGP